jgi:hypothetical protein
MPEIYCKMKEPGYRVLKCPRYKFEADKDAVAVMNIEMKALFMMEGKSPATPTAPQMTDVTPNRCGEPASRPKRNTRPLERGEVNLKLKN